MTHPYAQGYALSVMRFAIIALAMAVGLGMSVAQFGCAHPYSGKPEKLKKPKKKKKPEVEEEVATGPVLDDKCKANFFGDPTKKRKTRRARSLASQADALLAEAEGREGQPLISSVTDALSKLTNSLKAIVKREGVFNRFHRPSH